MALETALSLDALLRDGSCHIQRFRSKMIEMDRIDI